MWAETEPRPLRLLIVDDNATFTEFLLHLFAPHRWVEVVGCATHGRAGVDLAATLSPDVVLMDIEMPVLNGIDATREILARAHVPVLFVTASADDAAADEALAAGARAVLPKSIDPAQLVAQVFALYRERNEAVAELRHGAATAQVMH